MYGISRKEFLEYLDKELNESPYVLVTIDTKIGKQHHAILSSKYKKVFVQDFKNTIKKIN